MNLFGKVEYRKIKLPFYYIEDEELDETETFSIEATGILDGVQVYFYYIFTLTDPFLYHNEDYEDMKNVLKKMKNGEIVINLKYKKKILKDFQLEDKALAQSTGDQRFEYVENFYRSFDVQSSKK